MIFINKKTWNTFSEDQLNEYKEKVFQHYRQNGFPYFKLKDGEFEKTTDRLTNKFDSNSLLKPNNILSQNMSGLNIVNSFMPHMWSTKCRGFKSSMETFEDDVAFRRAIDKRISMGDNMSDAGMRKALSWSHGTHRVSNFRPTIAKYIYDNYSGGGDVLDFSCGYGGRLYGAICSKKVKSYSGVEPQIDTFNGLNEIIKTSKSDIKLNIQNIGFEDRVFNKEYYDLSFSSPPYFNTEEYAYDSKQSFVKYPTKNEWRDGFLYPLIEKNYRLLKGGGYFIINAANVKTYQDLEDDVMEHSTRFGFEYIKTYKMTLSALMGKGFKYEPIFVFKKP